MYVHNIPTLVCMSVMVVFTTGLSNLTDVSLSLNPLQSRGIVTLLHSLPTGHLSHLSIANTCTLPTEALEQPKVLEFFKQVK